MSVVLSPSTLCIAALALVCVVHKYRRYIAGCRTMLVTSERKTSAIVRRSAVGGLEGEQATLHDIVHNECPSLTDAKEAMVPTAYLPTGLLQTIYATMRIRRRDSSSTVEYVREMLTMSDGATVSLDWCDGSMEASDSTVRPVILVLSGVGGSSQEHHIRALAQHLVRSLKACVVVVNHRGTAGTPITAPRPYDVGFTDDVRAAIAHIGAKFPQAKLAAVGFSMGANVLTKYMGEEGMRCPLACAVIVCCPFDIVVSGAAMDESNVLNNHVFQPAVMSTLMRAIKRAQHLELKPEWNVDIGRIRTAKRLSVLEDELLVKINGYRDREEYYVRSSSARFVEHITVPLLAINSLDDRITPPQGIPVHKFMKNPNVALALVPHGGHLGFLTGIPPRIWFIKPIGEFIAAIIK